MGKVGTIGCAAGQNPGFTLVSSITSHYKGKKDINHPIQIKEPGLYKVTVTAYETNYGTLSCILRLLHGRGDDQYAYTAWPASSYIHSLNTIIPVKANDEFTLIMQLGNAVSDYNVNIRLHKITL